MKTRWLTLGLALLAATPAARATPPDPALLDRTWLLETLLYSYYWYLDDAFFAAAAEWQVIVLPHDVVTATLQSARHHLQVPGPATKEVVLKILRKEMKQAGVTGGPQRFFLAARTGVATDVWVYWQNRRVILQVSGDMDITDPAVVAHVPLLVRQFNLGSNVVASVLEAEGSNALITRDRASRLVFMCVVRGEEIVLYPAAGP